MLNMSLCEQIKALDSIVLTNIDRKAHFIKREEVLAKLKPLMAHLQNHPKSSDFWSLTDIRWFEELDKHLAGKVDYECFKRGTALSPEDAANHLRLNVCIKRKRIENLAEESFRLSEDIHDILVKSGRVEGYGYAKIVNPAVYDYMEKLSKELLGDAPQKELKK